MAGAFGSTASIAASAQESSSDECPKYRQAAASSPTTFPPKGACETYMDRIFSFEARNSSRVARIISMNFSPKVRDSFLARRIVCMVRVLPPLTMRLFFRFW